MNSQKKSTKLEWTPEMDQQFQQLKEKFKTAPIHAVPDFDSEQPFELTTDYLGRAISAEVDRRHGPEKDHSGAEVPLMER